MHCYEQGYEDGYNDRPNRADQYSGIFHLEYAAGYCHGQEDLEATKQRLDWPRR